jgi:hypothetical protein
MAIRVDKADAVAHQPAGQNELAIWVNGGNRMTRRKRYQLRTADKEQGLGRDK